MFLRKKVSYLQMLIFRSLLIFSYGLHIYDAVSSSDCIVLSGRMINKWQIWKLYKEGVIACLRHCSSILWGELRKTIKPSVTIVCDLKMIQARHFWNTSQKLLPQPTYLIFESTADLICSIMIKVCNFEFFEITK